MRNKTEIKISTSKKILIVITNIALVFLLTIGILLVVTLMPIKGNYQVMSVLSGSMSPTIPVGSLIVVKPSPSYQSGDVITFLPTGLKLKKESVTHRIFSVYKEGDVILYQTKGDANESPDVGAVTEDRIIGKYLFSVVYLGYILSYVKTLPGLLLLIILPSIIIIFEEVKKIRKEAKLLILRRRKNVESKVSLSKKKSKKPKVRKGEND